MPAFFDHQRCETGGTGIGRLKAGEHMTHLELVAEVGSRQIEVVNMYMKGMITAAELESVIGTSKAQAVKEFLEECKT